MEGAASDWSCVTSGVPQGSILGLSFFYFSLTTSQALYPVDDTKLPKAVTCNEDCVQLQEALRCAEKWSKDSNINFNPSKCKGLAITRRKTPFIANYYLCSTEIKSLEDEVDLGIIVTCNLSGNNKIK